MLKTDNLIVNTSLLSNVDILLNNNISQDYNIKFAGRPLTSIGKNLSLLAQDAQLGGTNLIGGTVVISGGISTGSASSSILFKTAKGGSSGTTDNTPSTKLQITGTGVFANFLASTINPTTSDIPVGTSSVYKNTTTGDIQVWLNDGGTVKTLTPPSINSSSDYWLSAKITYNVIGDGLTNDAANLTSAFSASNTIVYLPSGTYKIDTTISISNVNNLKIIGTKNTKITSSLVKTLLSTTTCNNIEIIDVVFESTVSDAGSTADTTNGLLKVNGGTDLKVISCTFNATNAITDGIKITTDSTHVVTGLIIKDSNFNGIGQRGIEVTAANFTSQYLTNAIIADNKFNNLGTKVVAAGQAISLKVYGTGVDIHDNYITDANTSAIEADGVFSLIIVNNIFSTINRAYSPFSIRNLTSGKTTSGLIITDNNINVRDVETNTVLIEGVTEFTFSSNYIRAGAVNIKGTKGKIGDNNILSDDVRALYLETPSSDNFFTSNVFDNSTNVSALEPVITDGTGVDNNVFTDNNWRTKVGNNPYVFGSGSTNNIFVTPF